MGLGGALARLVRWPDSAVGTIALLVVVAFSATVVMAALPLVQEARRRDLEDQGRNLRLVARTAASTLDIEDLAAGTVDASRATAKLEELLILGGGDQAAVTDRSGAVLVSVDLGSDVPPAGFPDVVLVRCGVDPGLGGTILQEFVRVNLGDGEPRVASCVAMPDGDGADVGFVVVLERARRASANVRLERRVWLHVVATGLVAVLGVLLGVQRILAPVRAISAAARRIARGERGVRVAPGGVPALRELAGTFNGMASSVEAREDDAMNRLEVVYRFARVVAHEVRNPLQSLALLADLARRERDPDARRRHLTSIEREIHGLEATVQRFLRAPDRLEVRFAVTDLARVAEDLGVRLAPLARERGLALDLAVQSSPVVADAVLVGQALENLVRNAMEAVQEREGARIEVLVRPVGDRVHLLVADNGPGVPEARRERIFEPYVTQRPGGTGLGLALVRQVAEAHRGRVTCTTSTLGGAAFELVLPRNPREEQASGAVGATGGTAPGPG